MFVDKVQISVKAGNGGDGIVSFRREKFVDRGGPNGGDGGHGGDVILKASNNENTLAAFRYNKKLSAESGEPGGKNRKHGKSGKDLVIKVPVGTVITNDSSEILADLTDDGQEVVIAFGGQGGYGNAHFVSSTRQAPKLAEKGEKTEEITLSMELKMIADIGLVGLPNAGKSTLLSALSNARPEIADYPFTTLVPNLGVVDIDSSFSVLMADIPGLIEGASQGKGLGIQFLRHIERTQVLVHLIDVYSDDVVSDYKTVIDEISAYQASLVKRPQLIALTKVDGFPKEDLKVKMSQLKEVVPIRTKVIPISSLSGEGINELKKQIKQMVSKARLAAAAKEAKKASLIPIIRLENSDDSWSVKKSETVFIVSGFKIERFARRTDFSNNDAQQRLIDIMRKMGILKELEKKGLKPGDKIGIGSYGSVEY